MILAVEKVNNNHHQVVVQVQIEIIKHQGIRKYRLILTKTNHCFSPNQSNNVHVSPSRESSRHNSMTKQEQRSSPVPVNKDSRRSSDIDDGQQRTLAKPQQERTPSSNKRQKSSSTVDENNQRRPSFQQRSGEQSKRNSNVITDETVVTPIIMDSSKGRQQNGKVCYFLRCSSSKISCFLACIKHRFFI